MSFDQLRFIIDFWIGSRRCCSKDNSFLSQHCLLEYCLFSWMLVYSHIEWCNSEILLKYCHAFISIFSFVSLFTMLFLVKFDYFIQSHGYESFLVWEVAYPWSFLVFFLKFKKKLFVDLLQVNDLKTIIMIA